MGDLSWIDLRCRCGADHVIALAPGFDPRGEGGGTLTLFDPPAIKDRAWCVDCWRASFVSVSAARGAAVLP
jgi:hypothetical protein